MNTFWQSKVYTEKKLDKYEKSSINRFLRNYGFFHFYTGTTCCANDNHTVDCSSGVRRESLVVQVNGCDSFLHR